MQLELIGCTSAGKSTLATQLLTLGALTGVRMEKSYDYVLRRYQFGWVRAHKVRMLLLNLLAIGAALVVFWQRPRFGWWLLSYLCNLPAPITLGERLKIARITWRNLGIHHLIQQAPPDRLILADEGCIQAAHYLFVNLAQQPDLAALDYFLHQIPLPDLVLYYKQPEALLVERTLRRGHKRIARSTPAQVQCFIHHAYTTFEYIGRAASLRRQIIMLDGQSHQILQQPQPLEAWQQPITQLLTLLAMDRQYCESIY